MTETIALWIIAISLVVGVIALLWLIDLLKRTEQVLSIQMKSLSETHLQGLEILTMDVDKLKARVKELEEEVL
jgi:uncharacterized protein YoxC